MLDGETVTEAIQANSVEGFLPSWPGSVAIQSHQTRHYPAIWDVSEKCAETAGFAEKRGMFPGTGLKQRSDSKEAGLKRGWDVQTSEVQISRAKRAPGFGRNNASPCLAQLLGPAPLAGRRKPSNPTVDCLCLDPLFRLAPLALTRSHSVS